MENDSLGAAVFCRPCWVDIDLGALRQNFRKVKEKISSQTAILSVVKANAYGHGASQVAKVLVEESSDVLGVSSIEEGVALRQDGITVPILILGSIFPFDNFPYLFDYRLTPTIASREAAEALQSVAVSRGAAINVHLKIDSGFGRIGVSPSKALDFITFTTTLSALSIEGIYTHFASADMDPEYTQHQLQAFQTILEDSRAICSPRWIHAANSSALLRFPNAHGTLVRPGLALYGVDPYLGSESVIELKPVLSWKTRVVYLKWIPERFPISYARTWISKRPTRVATLAVGYADGYPRALSNKGYVLVHGQRASIIGRITMDMIMVDVTDIAECRVGDEVVLIGSQGEDKVLSGDLARMAQTNAYEILCRIGSRVPRFYTNGKH